MAWLTLTADDMRQRLSDQEMAAYESAVGELAPPSRLPALLRAECANVVSRVNAYRRKAGLPFVSPPDLTIPPGAEPAVFALVRLRLANSIPAIDGLFGENRRAEADMANNYLRDIASGDVDHDEFGAAEFTEGTSRKAMAYGSRRKIDHYALT